MGYCTEDQVRKSLGNLPVSAILSADVLEIIDEATSRIDSFISIKYSLPLATPVPKMIQRLCRDIAACHIYEDIIAQGVAVADSPKIKTRCEKAEKTLEDIRDGKQRIIKDDGTMADESDDAASNPWSSTSTFSSFFDIDEPVEWKWSELEIDAVKDKRDD
jgi:phage gp36-like protein